MPIVTSYFAKSGKTGEKIKDFFFEQLKSFKLTHVIEMTQQFGQNEFIEQC